MQWIALVYCRDCGRLASIDLGETEDDECVKECKGLLTHRKVSHEEYKAAWALEWNARGEEANGW